MWWSLAAREEGRAETGAGGSSTRGVTKPRGEGGTLTLPSVSMKCGAACSPCSRHVVPLRSASSSACGPTRRRCHHVAPTARAAAAGHPALRAWIEASWPHFPRPAARH